jgi:hypothetical protein
MERIAEKRRFLFFAVRLLPQYAGMYLIIYYRLYKPVVAYKLRTQRVT